MSFELVAVLVVVAPDRRLLDRAVRLRRQVEALAAYGIPEYEISRVVGIDPKTLRKYYFDELDLGATKANAQVAGFLFNSARNGNVSAQIFWLKTRARWRETPTEHEITSKVDVSQMTDAELERRIAFLSNQMERSGQNPDRIFQLAGVNERKR